MPDLTVSANVDTLLQAANFSAFRTSLGLGSLATVTPGTGIATALAINVGNAGAPTLFNGAGGTPSSIVLTNATGTAAGLTAGTASAVAVGGITGLGANVATFLATPSSANLASAVTGETGSGALVFGTSPLFTTNFTLANGASPTTSAVAQMAFDTDAWAASRGAVAVHDGTEVTWLVGVLASDTPSNGQVPTWNTGGTITWETPGGAANAVTAASAATGAGLFWTSGGADRTAVATDTVTTLNVTTAAVTNLLPVANDGAAIGASGTAFSDLFLASGAVINFNAGNYTLTHSAGVLTANLDFRVTTAGTNSASVVTVGGTQTLTGKSIAASQITAGVLGGNITLGESTGQIILDPTLSADGTWSGIMQAGTAGATLAFGDLIYLAAADSRWELADADAASTSGDVVLGMCVLAAAADGDPTNVLLYGKIRADAAFPTLTIGAPAYAGTTAGDIQTAQPSGTDDVIRVVGYGLTADVLLFNPAGFYITHT